MKAIILFSLVAVAYSAATDKKITISATTPSILPYSSEWIFTAVFDKIEMKETFCTPKVAITAGPVSLEEAKATYILTDYTGFDKTDTIYYDLEHTTELLDFEVYIHVDIPKNTSVSLTFNVTCPTEFLGNYTSSIKDISDTVAVAVASSAEELIVSTILYALLIAVIMI
jgi:hypothetical protein